MNYAEQQSYLGQSRIWATLFALVWVLTAAISFTALRMPAKSAVPFGLVVVAIAISLLYTPDYLHLTVNNKKKARWSVMIRWRIIAAALIIGLLWLLTRDHAGNWKQAAILLSAVAWLACINFLAQKLNLHTQVQYFLWVTDFALLATVFLAADRDCLLIIVLLAGSVHFAIVTGEGSPFAIAAWVAVLSALLPVVVYRFQVGQSLLLASLAMILSCAGGTAWLVYRAQLQNAKNTQAAVQELMEFTGYPAERIWRLWSESDKKLARNWVDAALDESDAKALAEWYRQNSELYMFAISGYNLDYKRIRSNLNVLRFARGACLDYGAGNGEIVLEMARRGHQATYYDVDGVSAKFAKHRAQRQGLDVKFLHTKDDLKAAALRFDTMFALDVLEHLPDLPGELTFLASLLSPGGHLVFDVPAGSTRSHPMHLNHHVDVHTFLTSKGLREQRSWWLNLPFVRQEKYAFEKLVIGNRVIG